MEEPSHERCHRCYRPLNDGVCPSCAQRTDVFEVEESSAASAPSELLPPAPTGGFTETPSATTPPPTDQPRVLIWLIIAGITALYFMLGGGESGVASSTLLDAGRLTKPLFETLSQDWWRLVLATFLHSQWFLLLISALMIWILGGPAERRAGGGLVFFLLVVGGTLLNVLRVGLEPAGSLVGFAGAWPAGLAMGAAALALGHRTPGPRPKILISIVFEVGILLIIAFQSSLFSWGMVMVMGCALGLGAFVGSVWPLDASRGPTGCFATGFCALMLVFALWGRSAGGAQPTAPPLEWRTSNPEEWRVWQDQNSAQRGAVSLEATPIPDLELELEVPAGWSRQHVPQTAECPECEEQVDLPEEPPETEDGAKPTVDCPNCGAKVRFKNKKKRVQRVVFQESALFGLRRQLMISAWPRGAFDAADTLAQRLIADFGSNESWFKSPNVAIDQAFVSEAMGRGHLICLRGRIQGNAVVMRLYVFVGKDRTVFLRALDQDSGNPADWEASEELFDRIARTVRPLKAGKKKRKKNN